MARRPQYHLDLGQLPPLVPNPTRSTTSTAASSPIEPPASSGGRFAQSNGPTIRNGSSSPSHDWGSRFYPRRAREIQASEGHTWGPPTASGLSTPLRETIPESPGDDSFPDLGLPATEDVQHNLVGRESANNSAARRARAGTVPSRFPGGVPSNTAIPQYPASKSSRPTPSTSPFRPGTASVPDSGMISTPPGLGASSAALSRFRAGSLPQRSNALSSQSPFGPSVFSTNWNSSRERASTLMTVHSDELNSPTLPGISRDTLTEMDLKVKTLDYLGLVDTPQQNRAADALSGTAAMSNGQGLRSLANYSELNRSSSSRFRSFSVNAKSRYADDSERDTDYETYQDGPLTPATITLSEQIRQHNLEVQAYAAFGRQAASGRPRAQTLFELRKSVPLTSQPDQMQARYGITSASDYNDLADDFQAMSMSDFNGNEPLPSSALEGATRAIWLGSVPASTTESSLMYSFQKFGSIESAKVLTLKSCAFVNFENVESAVRARHACNGKVLFQGSGTVRINFAKAPSASSTPNANGRPTSPSLDLFTPPSNNFQATNGTGSSSVPNQEESMESRFGTPSLAETKAEILRIIRVFDATEDDCARASVMIHQAIENGFYEPSISAAPELPQSRLFDAGRLREIRKRCESNNYTQSELDNIAGSMMPELKGLCPDYLGNTVVQKLFEGCSDEVKEMMIREIAPTTAQSGVHKNGTWAIQKMIETARTPSQMMHIVQGFRKDTMACFLDQYGNYVVQGCLKFPLPFNIFIFECMLSKLWEIAQNRFGARAMRACLESHHASKDYQRLVAAAIAVHCIKLAINANGSLLLTWYLDTCSFANKRAILAPRLIPHLVELCTHKVAYLSVLKLINQRNEPAVRGEIMNALFFSPDDQILTEVLRDPNCGSTLIFKILTAPWHEDTTRPDVITNVRKVLQNLQAQPSQGYKRLMDEIGLSTRAVGSSTGRDSVSDTPRSQHGSQASSSTAAMPQMAAFDRQFSGGGYGFPIHNPADTYEAFVSDGRYTANPGVGSFAPQQMQFQGAPGRAQGIYGYPTGGFANPLAPQHISIAPSPMMSNVGYNSQMGYGPVLGMNGSIPGMYAQYPGSYMVAPQQQMHGHAAMGAPRRGRH